MLEGSLPGFRFVSIWPSGIDNGLEVVGEVCNRFQDLCTGLWFLYQGWVSEERYATGIWRGYSDVVSLGPVGGNCQVPVESQRYQPRFPLRIPENQFP